MKSTLTILIFTFIFSTVIFCRDFTGIGYWALDQEKQCGISVDTSCYLLLDSIIISCREKINLLKANKLIGMKPDKYSKNSAISSQIQLKDSINKITTHSDVVESLTIVSSVLKDFNFKYDSLRSYASALSDRKFDCRFYTLTYLTVSENLNLHLSYSLLPMHIVVNGVSEIDNRQTYFEPTTGKVVSAREYIDNYNSSDLIINLKIYLLPKPAEKFKSVIYTDLGSYFVQKGDLQNALNYFSKALSADILYPPALINNGVARAQLGDYRGAIDNYTKLLDLDPNYKIAYLHRGNAKSALGDIEGACSDWKKAKEMGTEDAIIMINKYCK